MLQRNIECRSGQAGKPRSTAASHSALESLYSSVPEQSGYGDKRPS